MSIFIKDEVDEFMVHLSYIEKYEDGLRHIETRWYPDSAPN